ncbi:unnamed protein product [Phytophthora lilii]|uniref:Unnamed protein product n=1 Tax=Phytophthora lilii TaxID=2077276 RepID=A0A9W7CMK5_9STRA|nr:unnamed protein product [Phytophthora lilii]
MYSTMMLDGSDSLDDVLSFLSQIDLPALTPLDEATHAAGVQEVHDPSPLVDLLAAPSAVERFSVDQNILQQTPVPFDVPQVDSLSSQVVPTRPNSPTSSEDSPELTGTESSKSKPKRIRISRKQQIETLREEVQELQAELQTLIPQWQSGPKHLSLRLNGQCVPRQASMWQQIAARQLERRQKSEEDNARLRDMLQIQLMEEMLGMKRHKLLEYGVPEDNSQVYEDMMSDIDELYVGTEELLAQKGMHDLPCPGRHRVAHCNVTDGLFLELLQRHSVPFELRKTEKALWKAIRRIEFQDLNTVKEFANIAQFHAVNIEESTNTMKISYFVEAPNIAFLKGAQVRKSSFERRILSLLEKTKYPDLRLTSVEPAMTKASQQLVTSVERQTWNLGLLCGMKPSLALSIMLKV